MLSQTHWVHELNQNRLKSEITIHNDSDGSYEIVIFHKAFSEDSSLLLNLLKNPHEERIEDKVWCRRVSA